MLNKGGSVLTLFDIPFLSANEDEVIDLFSTQIEDPKDHDLEVIFTPNPEQVTLAFHDSEFHSLLRQADWNLPDGQGIVFALKRKYPGSTRQSVIQRLAGRTVFHDLLVRAKDRGWKVFLLGGRRGSARAIARNFQFSIHNFQFDEGAKDISHETNEEEARVLGQIKAAKPQLLFVAYGAPWQERWVSRHKVELAKAGVKLAMVVGGAFDYEAGFVPQVPKAIEAVHLEWLWRLVREPWRWRRQLKGLEFFARVLC